MTKGIASWTGKRALRAAIPLLGAGMLIAVGLPAPVAAQSLVSTAQVERDIAERSDDLRPFYATRSFRPLWLNANGRASPAVGALLDRLDTAEFDGLGGKELRKFRTKSVRKLLRRATSGDPEAVARAEIELSSLLAEYVKATRVSHSAEMIYESPALAPSAPTTLYTLKTAADSGDLENYIRSMGWMHPFYAGLRDAMEQETYNLVQRRAIWENLSRVRALPATAQGRYVLVDAAGSTLWMYEDGRPVDTMKVVVGKPAMPTPMMAGFLRHAIVNPYWNVPPDLVQQNIATNVLDKGLGYLRERGYEVVSDYSPGAKVIDPKTVDWKSVAGGRTIALVRQKPGGDNFMGKVKYEFPNAQGIYLHDTPDRHLLKEDQRQLSSGCVRLENADKLGRWLFGKPMPKPGRKAEQRFELPEVVPVYITYLTAMPTNTGIAFREDIYGRDGGPQLASVTE